MADFGETNQPATKRMKIDISKELRPGVKLSDISVVGLDTIFNDYSTSLFRSIESCFHHELRNDYFTLQLRLAEAQKPRLNTLIKARQLNNVPKPTMARRLGRLLGEMTKCPEIKDTVKDAMRYYEATCIGLAVFSQPEAMCKKLMEEWVVDMDPVKYFEDLIEAAERYLKAKTTSLASSTSSEPSKSSKIAAPPMPSAVSASGTHAPFTDEYLRDKVSDFIVKDLSSVVPWDQLDDCGIDIKTRLQRVYRRINPKSLKPDYRRTPPGVLLHGDQGTGKTAIVTSFAAYNDMTLFRVGGTMHGSLKGQSEKLIQYIFDAVRLVAADKPCVLFFDEADALLGGHDKDSTSLEGLIKQLWGDLINDKIACFIFGATNKPWNINMSDYGRRFKLKVHVTIPGDQARERIVKHSLSKYWHIVDEKGMNEIAAVTKGLSTNDIVDEIESVADQLVDEMFEADEWVEMDKGGSIVWVSAADNEQNARKGQMSDFRDVEPRPITTSMVTDHLQSGTVQSTSSPMVEEKHQQWNAQWKR